MKQGETPVSYREIPENQLRLGRAVQHDGTTESALAIVEWLQNERCSAWATPQTKEYPALIRLKGSFRTDQLVGPDDWVFLEPGGFASSFTDEQFNRIFVHEGDTTPIFKSYTATFRGDN